MAAFLSPSADLWRLGLVYLLAIVLLTLAIIDLEHRRLPNSLVVVVLVLALGLALAEDRSFMDMMRGAGIMLAAALILRFIGVLLLSKPGVGWGDIKLAGAVGLGIGAGEWPVFLAVLALSLALLLVVFARRKPVSLAAQVPIGPAMCAAAFAVFV